MNRVLNCFCILVVSLLCLLCFAPEAHAVTEYTSGDYTYTVSDGEATITGYTGTGGDITIPSTLDGYPVTVIGNSAFKDCIGLTSVTIPDSVIKIRSAPFSGCSSLESITIPFVGGSRKTDTDTYQYPFGHIFGTTDYAGSVEVLQAYHGSSTTHSTYSTYYIPASLKSVTVTGGEILDGSFYNCSMLTNVTIPNSITSIGESAFYGCSGLTSMMIPNCVATIGSFAFYGCTGLTSMTIPDSVTIIDGYAFYKCASLGNVTISDHVTGIGDNAFSCCTSLTSVTIPDSIVSIGEGAFSGCSSLESITIPFVGGSRKTASDTNQYPFGYIFGTSSYADSIETEQTYRGTSTTHLTSKTYYIPSSLKSVTVTGGEILLHAFHNCTGLTSVTIGESGAGIGWGAFENCTGLTSITLPDSVTNIGGNAFSKCNSLGSVTIPDSVTTIGDYAFDDCRKLTSVTIGDGVTAIGNCAFNYCSKLTSITIPDKVTTIGIAAFEYCTSLTNVTISDNVTSIGSSAFLGCTNLVDVYYSGAQSKWEKIEIGSNNGSLTSARIQYLHTHDYTLLPAVTTPADCLNPGYIDYTCVYGELYREVIPALGHDYTDVESVVMPTCTQYGYIVYGCTRCEATKTESVSSFGHNYTEVESVVAPNCTEQGYTVYGCIRCNATKITDYVSALGHSYTNVESVIAPNCTEQGYTVYGCSRCEATIITDYISAMGHSYTGTVTVVDPTCITLGYTESQCIRCVSVERSNYTDLVAHKMVLVPAVEATCTTTGLTAGTCCQVCSKVGVAQTVTPQLSHTIENGVCTQCGDLDISEVRLSGASPVLYENMAIQYKANKTKFDTLGITDPYLVVTFNGVETVITDYQISDDGTRYIFTFYNIAPNQMNDTITAVLYATYNGEVYAANPKDYSMAEYCYTQLGKYSDEAYAEFRTLLVDLLNYGAVSQQFTGYKTDNLVNAALTETQKSWATQTDRSYTNVQTTKYATISNPTVSWKGGSLVLTDAVVMRLRFETANTDGLTFKVTSGSSTWWISDISTESGSTYIYFRGLNAGQMSDEVFITAYQNGVAVSNTVRYSIESYASQKVADTATPYLAELVDAMMKYGDSAKAYVH